MSRYWPFAAARRPCVTRRASAPYPPRLCASATKRRPSASRNSLPTMSGRPASRAAAWARTTPASEHSSVSASAAVAELLRALDELRRMRSAAQEREIADAMQLRIRHRASHPREVTPAARALRGRDSARSRRNLMRSLAGPVRTHRARTLPHRPRRARWRGLASKRIKFRRVRAEPRRIRAAARRMHERHPNTP